MKLRSTIDSIEALNSRDLEAEHQARVARRQEVKDRQQGRRTVANYIGASLATAVVAFGVYETPKVVHAIGNEAAAIAHHDINVAQSEARDGQKILESSGPINVQDPSEMQQLALAAYSEPKLTGQSEK